jgi:hypothetical protein
MLADFFVQVDLVNQQNKLLVCIGTKDLQMGDLCHSAGSYLSNLLPNIEQSVGLRDRKALITWMVTRTGLAENGPFLKAAWVMLLASFSRCARP